MVTKTQKSTIDNTHERKRNLNTALKLVIKTHEKKTKESGKKKDLQKQIQNN